MSLKDYSPGDIIQSNCQPLYKTINYLTAKGKICDNCFSLAKSSDPDDKPLLQPCTCSLMFYCSTPCQLQDWKNGHQIECGSKTFQANLNVSSINTNLKNHLFRAMAFFALNPDLKSTGFPIYNGTSRCFNDLLSHQDFFQETNPNFKIVCAELADGIAEEGLDTGSDIIPDSAYFLKLAGIFQTNGFTIYNESETVEIGSGVYVQPSVFNHSCRPNALFSSRGTRLEIRAIAHIPKGQEPFISYIAKHAGKSERQLTLSTLYNFECHCERCENEDLDAGIDFEELNSLIEYIGWCCLNNCSKLMRNIWAMHGFILQTMRQIYNEYDSRISNQYSRTVFALLNNNQMEGRPFARKLIRDTRRHMEISCGSDHPEFLKFERAVLANTALWAE